MYTKHVFFFFMIIKINIFSDITALIKGNSLPCSPPPTATQLSKTEERGPSYIVMTDLNAKGIILKAFDQFRLKSCINFKPREHEDYYISVKKLEGCWSYIGRSKINGQELSIGQDCDQIATAIVEFFHALGFYHEHSRYDRDNFISIHLENVIEGFQYNFRKVLADVSTIRGTSYDYWSVMHYSNDAFSNGNGLTITTIDPAYQDIIGQRYEVSATDIKELNLYKCSEC
uniref:Metalloendopeptidase n=1 Tax=Periophthalmus magnuspinnatus TaxID=409849 RepID=A0A3B3ZJU9_9GOBI